MSIKWEPILIPYGFQRDILEYFQSYDYGFDGEKYVRYDFLPIVLYRYQESWDNRTISIELLMYQVLKETKCGYWYVDEHKKRWVSKGVARKKFCYETKEEAWESFKARKNKHAYHLHRKLNAINAVLQLIGEKEKSKDYEN